MAQRDYVRLLEIEPRLGARLRGQELADARRVAVAPVATLPVGRWDADGKLRRRLGGCEAFGAMVADGLVAHDLALDGRVATHLLGRGDILAPGVWPCRCLPAERIFNVAEPTRLALLDETFLAVTQRWPSIAGALLVQAERQSERVAMRNSSARFPVPTSASWRCSGTSPIAGDASRTSESSCRSQWDTRRSAGLWAGAARPCRPRLVALPSESSSRVWPTAHGCSRPNRERCSMGHVCRRRRRRSACWVSRIARIRKRNPPITLRRATRRWANDQPLSVAGLSPVAARMPSSTSSRLDHAVVAVVAPVSDAPAPAVAVDEVQEAVLDGPALGSGRRSCSRGPLHVPQRDSLRI